MYLGGGGELSFLSPALVFISTVSYRKHILFGSLQVTPKRLSSFINGEKQVLLTAWSVGLTDSYISRDPFVFGLTAYTLIRERKK